MCLGWDVVLLDVFTASLSLLYGPDLLAFCHLMILIDGWLSCVFFF